MELIDFDGIVLGTECIFEAGDAKLEVIEDAVDSSQAARSLLRGFKQTFLILIVGRTNCDGPSPRSPQ